MLKHEEFLKIRLTPEGISVTVVKQFVDGEARNFAGFIPIGKIVQQFDVIRDPLELQTAQRAQIDSIEQLLLKMARSIDFATKYGSSPALASIRQI